MTRRKGIPLEFPYSLPFRSPNHRSYRFSSLSLTLVSPINRSPGTYVGEITSECSLVIDYITLRQSDIRSTITDAPSSERASNKFPHYLDFAFDKHQFHFFV
jgi:hypothetical protein|uniref:Uncharacterized protein n=1 Tax=Picea glauca TaxID=3330 RepID=A0A101LX35_PICGL|nr:hypothetical protein ABT39_MTgene6404 [Picea glauca]QHR86263.1 hypothetical protein Q903MT_gene262 [Picea sitchensis]